MNSFLISLAAKSAWNRRLTLALVVFSIALSTLLLLSVERIRTDLRNSFSSAVSGTDVIVGPRTGAIQLLLYSVFRIGEPTNNVRWSSLQELEKQSMVAWIVPLSLGDSHKGFPVLGTSASYFEHFRYGDKQLLQLEKGARFSDLFDTVIGAEVAEKLGYKIGDRITLKHGSGELNLHEHSDKPFIVSGILVRTGTPVDRTVHISLEAMEALHIDWMNGVALPGRHISAEQARSKTLEPKNVTAALVGLNNRAAVFSFQRHVNQFSSEPLMAILPGVALDELWDLVGLGEKAMLLMSTLIACVSIAGMVAVVLAGLNERRRELAILRAVGATPGSVIGLLLLEGFLITILGILIGIILTVTLGTAVAPWLQSTHGLQINVFEIADTQLFFLTGLLLTGWAASFLPALQAYRLSLADGLSPRI